MKQMNEAQKITDRIGKIDEEMTNWKYLQLQKRIQGKEQRLRNLEEEIRKTKIELTRLSLDLQALI